jgi:hypothetical protein
MKRPLGIANRSSELRDLRKLADADFLRETFTLPLHAARLKARQILDEKPQEGHMMIVENWRQLSDGRIEFTMRKLASRS